VSDGSLCITGSDMQELVIEMARKTTEVKWHTAETNFKSLFLFFSPFFSLDSHATQHKIFHQDHNKHLSKIFLCYLNRRPNNSETS